MAQGCSLRSSNPSWGIHLFDLSSKGSQSIVPFFLEKITSFWNRLFITFNDDLSIFRQIYANSKQCDYGWIKLTQYYLFGKKKSKNPRMDSFMSLGYKWMRSTHNILISKYKVNSNKDRAAQKVPNSWIRGIEQRSESEAFYSYTDFTRTVHNQLLRGVR